MLSTPYDGGKIDLLPELTSNKPEMTAMDHPGRHSRRAQVGDPLRQLRWLPKRVRHPGLFHRDRGTHGVHQVLTFALIASSLLLSVATHAQTTSTGGGIECRSSSSSLQADYRGAGNTSTSARLNVQCPLPLPYPASELYMAQVRFYDGNATNSSIGDLQCSFYALYDDGSQSWSPTIHSCDTAHGCTGADPTFVGAGYLTIGNPFDGPFLRSVSQVGVSCDIPAKTSSGAISWIRGVWGAYYQ